LSFPYDFEGQVLCIRPGTMYLMIYDR
jgi:hypothetical protein